MNLLLIASLISAVIYYNGLCNEEKNCPEYSMFKKIMLFLGSIFMGILIGGAITALTFISLHLIGVDMTYAEKQYVENKIEIESIEEKNILGLDSSNIYFYKVKDDKLNMDILKIAVLQDVEKIDESNSYIKESYRVDVYSYNIVETKMIYKILNNFKDTKWNSELKYERTYVQLGENFRK